MSAEVRTIELSNETRSLGALILKSMDWMLEYEGARILVEEVERLMKKLDFLTELLYDDLEKQHWGEENFKEEEVEEEEEEEEEDCFE